MKSLIILAGAIAITLLTGSRIMPIIKSWQPAPPINCNNTMDPTTQSTYIHVDIPAVDGLMCAITAFFTEARVNSEAISPRLWDVIASPLLDYFVAAFVAMSIEDSRFGPKFIPLLSWGVLHTIFVGTASQLFGASLAFPALWLAPWALGQLLSSFSKDPRSQLPSPLGRPSQIRATAFVSVAFLIFSLFISHGPLALMKPMVLCFNGSRLLLPSCCSGRSRCRLTTAPQTLWTTVFLAIDNVSLGATGKSVLSILGALIYVVVAVPLVGVGATVLMAAVEREREVMALRAKLGMTAVDGGKKKKRA
ncbi:hypothetical protein BC829DRAFT_381526 [Chytridium lagenaria]|nr:hypothetical protein BC829DRAFT_381526 [Chytridium lagenaria]